MPLSFFRSLEEKNKEDAVHRLIVESAASPDFFAMIALAVVMSALGLLMDNASVIIGSMLIAPLLSPILSLAMGIVMVDAKLIARAIRTIAVSSLVSVALSAFVVMLFSSAAGLSSELNAEIISRLRPDVLFASVALVSGFAASYALIKPQLSATLPGVAISVALIPPLAVTGLGVARLDLSIVNNAFLLFLVNAACITFAATIVFSLARIHTKQAVAVKAIKREEKELEKQAVTGAKP